MRTTSLSITAKRRISFISTSKTATTARRWTKRSSTGTISSPARDARADGTITHTEDHPAAQGRQICPCVEPDGCDKAWFDNRVCPMSTKAVRWQKLKYHGLNGGEKVRGEYLCVPLSFLCEVFGAKYEPSEDTLTAVVTLPGRQNAAVCARQHRLRDRQRSSQHVLRGAAPKRRAAGRRRMVLPLLSEPAGRPPATTWCISPIILRNFRCSWRT